MAAPVKERRIWILIKRFDLAEENSSNIPKTLKDVLVRPDTDSEFFRQQLRETFQLQDSDLILKLRNHRGSLIPVNSNIMANSKSVPYVMEVVRMHQFVKPKTRSVKSPKYNEAMKLALQGFLHRIEKLEGSLPELRQRRNEKIRKDMEELDRKLIFLNKRFDDADTTDWRGMFKKNPMW